MIRHVVLTVFVLAALTPVAHAIPTITLPDFTLQPNTSLQVITLEVTGGDPVPHLSLSIEIGDGTDGPILTAVDSTTATIFSGNVGTPFIYGGSLPGRTFGVAVSTVNGFVAANGVIARLTLDTTGILGGPGPDQEFELRLTNIAVLNPSDTFFGIDDEFEPIPANIVYTHPEAERPYSLLIIPGSPVPEPGSMLLAIFALTALILSGHHCW